MGRKKDRLVFGWGVNDVDYPVTVNKWINGKNIQVWFCPYYAKWRGIIERCFCPKYQEKYPTYKGCTIYDEWKYLSNFIKWVDEQSNKDWQSCVPDKDFLCEGFKHYSPYTVVFIPDSLNSFILDRGNGRGNYMLGVTPSRTSNTKPYKAQCHNPFTKKQEYLGLFETELEAHLAWKAKKYEHACKLADMQQDSRIAERLREMYKDTTNLKDR
jgi:hypothetical protein